MSDAGLRHSLAGVRALLLDLDGVLAMRGKPLPGAAEALAALDRARFPYVIGTNMSLFCRATLSAEMTKGGIAVPPERIMCASSAAAAYCRRHWPNDPLYVMGAADGLREFADLSLLTHEQAASRGAKVAAVVVGDAGSEFTPANMQTAFRLVREGARFVAMHKNRWWITPDGPTLDSGAYVSALEFGTEKKALVTGKPSAPFFLEGVRALEPLAGRKLHPAEVAMVGDDLWNDILGAQRAGLKGVFVRSGKQGDPDLARLRAQRGSREPDAIAPSITEVAEWATNGK